MHKQQYKPGGDEASGFIHCPDDLEGRRQARQGAMHLVSYVGILVVRQRFEGLEGNIGAAGRDPGELRRGHDTDPRLLVLERLFKLLESSVGIWIEPCRRRSAWKLGMAASLAYFLRITSMSLLTA